MFHHASLHELINTRRSHSQLPLPGPMVRKFAFVSGYEAAA